MKMMLLGTCRVHDPSKVLQNDTALLVRGTPHRLHTPRQTLQFIEHVSGKPRFDAQTAHLLSDYATDRIFTNNVPREQVLDDLKYLKAWWNRFDVFFIEISTFQEFSAKIGNRNIILNTFSKRDQEIHRAAIEAQAAEGLSVPPLEVQPERLTQRLVIEEMVRIKAALGDRPIVWLSHMRPPSDDPRYEVVINARQNNANVLRAGAELLGHAFFDPSVVAAEIGQKAFFLKDGEDLDHMTPAAAERLAEIYKGMAHDLKKAAAPAAASRG